MENILFKFLISVLCGPKLQGTLYHRLTSLSSEKFSLNFKGQTAQTIIFKVINENTINHNVIVSAIL
jgi:hypothetical protein